jgi:hypothetical protein
VLDDKPLDEVTDDDVRSAYLDKLGQQPEGVTGLLPDIFWQAGDMDLYKQAVAWWPKDAPPAHALPTLSELFPYGMGPETAQKVTARDALTKLGEHCTAWLVSEQRDPLHPNLTPQEAQRKRAAAAMQRSRELTRAAKHNPQADNVKRLHAAYIEACRVRKAAVQAVHDAHTPQVDALKLEWEEAKRQLEA